MAGNESSNTAIRKEMEVAKALMTLPSGATVAIEGTPEEVARILELNGGASSSGKAKPEVIRAHATASDQSTGPSVVELVNVAKSCDDAELIETKILDSSSQISRTLLPLFMIHEHFENRRGFTTGEISAFTTHLGSPISGQNVSHTLRGSASKYVMVDTAGKQDGPASYKINRRGIAYMKELLGREVLEN
jgi:hypothetical protein